MTSPRRATTGKGGKRFYEWRSERYWSVTTIIGGGVPKPALLPWGIKMVAEGAVEAVQKGTLPGMVEQDPDAAVGFLKNLPYAKRDRAADLGSHVHSATEAYVLGKPFPKWPATVKPRMDAFVQFLADFEPAYEMTEASVFNRTQRYAGTLDAICTIADRKLLLDTKTGGKTVYPETALQLAAYRHAEFIGVADGSEEPMPPVDGTVVLHLPEWGGYELVEVRADDEVFKSFLYAREVFRWQTDIAKTVILGPYPASLESAGMAEEAA